MRVKALIAGVTALGGSGIAQALIIHPQDEPFAGPQPAAAVVGRWSSNASLVAVAPNYAITTRHQGGGVGTVVTFAGNQYVVAEEIPHPSADLRVVRLELPGGGQANLAHWVNVYDATDELTQVATGSGFGDGRGATISQLGIPVGYEWGGAATRQLRFGRNRIDGTSVLSFGSFTSDVLLADFDPHQGLTSVQYECTIAEGDSGGGWFLFQGGEWKVAGLGVAVQNFGQAMFLPPEEMLLLRISSYASFIQASIPEDCYANCDGSTAQPVLNVADFSCFLQKFAAVDPYANCDGSTEQPVLNVADFSCFLQKFAAGCP